MKMGYNNSAYEVFVLKPFLCLELLGSLVEAMDFFLEKIFLNV